MLRNLRLFIVLFPNNIELIHNIQIFFLSIVLNVNSANVCLNFTPWPVVYIKGGRTDIYLFNCLKLYFDTYITCFENEYTLVYSI